MFFIVMCMCSLALATSFDWPFEKKLTAYDVVYLHIMPHVLLKEQVIKPDTHLIELLKKYSRHKNKQLLDKLPLELAALVAGYTDQQLAHLELLCSYVFPLTITWEYPKHHTGVIYFHGLGDTKKNFRHYVRSIIPDYALCGIDFYDHDNHKPYNIGTGLDLLMAAHTYFLAMQARPKSIKEMYLFGFSRGGGIIARLLAALKPQFYPAGSILLAPFINPNAGEHLYQGVMPTTIVPTIPECKQISTPLLIAHGTADTLIPYTESKRWAQCTARTGTPVYFLLFDHKDHIGILDAAATYIRQFLSHDKALAPYRL